MRFGWILLAVSLLVPCAGGVGSAQTENPELPAAPAAQPSSPASHTQPASPSASANYTLTPERRAKAVAYSKAQYVVYFVGALVSIGIYLLLWRARIAVLLRNWARKASRRHFIQCLIFVPLFVVAVTLLNCPLDYYSDFVLEHRFDLSTQGFASWLADWGKSLAIVVVLAVILVWVFYAVVRRSSRRWWFYFWMTSIPLVLAFLVIQPYVIEPLFYRFTPLEGTQPVLVERIEAMLKRAGLSIPPARIFEMDASSKTKAVDAYVSGLGSSKRVVVWDTTLKKMGSDELLLVLGHESGHYALHHIPKQFALDEALALLFFLLGFIAANRLVGRVGPRTGIEGVGDLASLPLILTVLSVVVFLSSPIENAISRYYEHQADQFGLEVAYGVVPDPNTAEVQALQILGEEDLADPDPSPFIKFWLYSHPPLEERIRFAASYKPWAEGKPLELLPNPR
jgi:Zn-dependent protease with chaperone function